MGGGGPKNQKQTTVGKTSTDVDVPDWLQPFVTQSTGVAGTALTDLQQAVQGYQLPPETLEALRSTAQGDFLYGGPGQQEFIDASIRAGQPGIINQFSGRPAGGGLAQAAIAREGQDAFSRLFQSERTNQLNAALALPGITQMPLALQEQLYRAGASAPGAAAPLFGSSGSSTSTMTQPIYQTPGWQNWLGAGTALAGLAMPGFGGTSALGNIGGGLLGLFR